MHANSLEAYHSLEDLGERESLVLDCYIPLIFPMTDRECMGRLGFNDPNKVRPRVTALVRAGLLEQENPLQVLQALKTTWREEPATPRDLATIMRADRQRRE